MPPKKFQGFDTFPGLSLRNADHCEAKRFASFKQWPEDHHLFPLKLAKEGFLHTGEADELRCSFCRFTRRGWKPGEKPEELHRISCPSCPIFDDNADRHHPLSAPPNVPIPVTSFRNRGLALADPARTYLQSVGFTGPQQPSDDDEDNDVIDLHDQRILQSTRVVMRSARRRGRRRGQGLDAVGIDLRGDNARTASRSTIRAAGVPVLSTADGVALVPFTARPRLSRVARYPGYSSPEKRRRSFDNGLLVMPVSSRLLVPVGFFCAGWCSRFETFRVSKRFFSCVCVCVCVLSVPSATQDMLQWVASDAGFCHAARPRWLLLHRLVFAFRYVWFFRCLCLVPHRIYATVT